MLNACNNLNKEAVRQEKQYSIKIVDSILIDYIGNLTFLSFSEKKSSYLFLDEKSGKIIITNTNGEIKHSFFANGDGDKDFGSILMTASWYKDTCVVIGSEKGYYFYSLNGYLLSKIPDKIVAGYTSSPKNFPIKTNNGEYFLSLRPLASDENELSFKNRKKTIEEYAPITMFNVKTKEKIAKFGYEANSIFKKYDYLYENVDIFFDFNYQENCLYVLHNPEQKVYIYDANNKFSLVSEIDLKCQHFEMPIKIKFNQSKKKDTDIIEFILRNSSFRNILSRDSVILITYTQGISEDNYKDFQQGKIQRGELSNYRKKYLQVFENRKKIGDDINIPSKLSNIAFFRNKSYILFYPNYSQVEKENQNIFYIAQLEELR
jgi:hypothetical protein